MPAVEDVFYITEDKDRNDKTIYRLKFKNDHSDVHKGFMSTRKDTCERFGYNWLHNKKNHEKILEVLFELSILNG